MFQLKASDCQTGMKSFCQNIIKQTIDWKIKKIDSKKWTLRVLWWSVRCLIAT